MDSSIENTTPGVKSKSYKQIVFTVQCTVTTTTLITYYFSEINRMLRLQCSLKLRNLMVKVDVPVNHTVIVKMFSWCLWMVNSYGSGEAWLERNWTCFYTCHHFTSTLYGPYRWWTQHRQSQHPEACHSSCAGRTCQTGAAIAAWKTTPGFNICFFFWQNSQRV